MIKFRWETQFQKTELGEIPQEWKSGKIGDVVEKIIKGSTPKLKKAKSKEWVPYLSVGYLRGVEDPNMYPSDAGYLVDDKEVLIIWDGAANAGEIILAKKGILGSTLSILIFKDGFNKYYFYRLFKLFQDEIKSLRSGTDDRHVDKNAFLNFRIPLPPPDEQRRIAAVLSWFDDLIENKKRQNEILENTAMALFKSWFVDFEPFRDEEFVYSDELGREVPRGWVVRPIGEVAEFLYGKGLPERKRKEGPYPVVGSSGIVGYHSEYLTNEPTLIVGRKGNAGRVILMLEPSFPIDTVFYTSENVAREVIYYLYFYLKMIKLNEYVLSDTAVPGLNIHQLTSIHLYLPPTPILQRFHEMVEPLFRKIINNEKEIMVLKKARDALLPLLVFGKLRVEAIE